MWVRGLGHQVLGLGFQVLVTSLVYMHKIGVKFPCQVAETVPCFKASAPDSSFNGHYPPIRPYAPGPCLELPSRLQTLP